MQTYKQTYLKLYRGELIIEVNGIVGEVVQYFYRGKLVTDENMSYRNDA